MAETFPEVELVDLELRGGRVATVTLYIDRPGGVDLELCSAVTAALDEVRESFALEVSSPGLDRPLRKPAHFAAALGRRIYVKIAAPRDGRSVFRGTLASASADGIELRLDEGEPVCFDYREIAKAHVIFDFDHTGGQHE